MDSSLNFRSRKRKQCSSLNPANGRFTRSKSQIYVHRSRSGRAWPDTPGQEPVHGARLLPGIPLEKPRNVHRPFPEIGASLDLSIKDLRTRARRVFSPASAVEEEGTKFEVGTGFTEEGCNGVSKMVNNCKILDLGIADSDQGVKNSDIYSDLGFACSGKQERRDREDVGSVSKDMDRVLGLGSHKQPDKEEGNLNEETTAMEKKDEQNEFETGKDCCRIKSNGSISGSRSVLNSPSKRKVFKAPGSFSYRRLLPFLREMAKDDLSISKIDVIDAGYPYKVQNLIKVASKCKHSDEPSDHTKTLVERDYQNAGVQLKGKNLDDPAKMSKAEGNVGLSGMEQKIHKNGINKADEMEDFVQTTPPKDAIFNKLDNDNARVSRETSALQSGSHVLQKPSNGNSSTNSTFMKSHPARKSDTISNAKLVLNRCFRSKIFKSSSFSYRRLLPFLTDFAKSSANISERPKLQREEGDSHSFPKESVHEHVPVNRRTRDNFPDNQDAEDQELFVIPVNTPISGSSDDFSPNRSTPFFSSGDGPLKDKLNTESSEAIAKSSVLLLERTSGYERVILDSSEKVELELSTNDIQSCPSESNCSSEKSCSTMKQESLTRESISDRSGKLEVELLDNNIQSCPCEANSSTKKSSCTTSPEPVTRESKSEVSQISEHETTYAGKECMAVRMDYHKDKLQLFESVGLYKSSLEIENFGLQGNQSDSPTKGILKRNSIGCIGLCNCLNCSSFRLHAERSFEFSKNQMLDAEEIAQGLINELVELRNLVERSVCGSNDLVGIQINQLQAKEACKRALEIEQLAKSRLSQMIDDLNIHCQIRPLQRPRVTFSRYIEEIATPKTQLLSSPNLQEQDEKTKR